MKYSMTQLVRRALASATFLILITFTSNGALPDWNNDVDGRNSNEWIGHSGSIYYLASDSMGDPVIRRWPPLPGASDDEDIITFGGANSISAIGIHDGHLYASGNGIVSGSNSESGVVALNGIARVNLETKEILDAVSAYPDPIPLAMAWDHNGGLYIGGVSALTGATYQTNFFKKWNGTGWSTVGGGLSAAVADQTGVRSLATDGTNIYVGGTFKGATNISESWNIICWNVDSNRWFGFPEGGVRSGATSGTVKSIALSGTNIFVSGNFTNSSAFDGEMARFSSINLMHQTFGTVAYTSNSGDVIVKDGIAYFAGAFSTVTNGGSVIAANAIVQWSNGTFSALGTGLTGDVGIAANLAANGNSIFVNGAFSSAGGLSCPGQTARWQLSADGQSATPLRFTSGSISSFTDAICTLTGQAGLVVEIQQLDVANDMWESQGSITLNSSGTGSFQLPLDSGYGYFRAKSIEGTYYSTNAFGSIVGSVASGKNWLIGNPFGPLTPSQILPGAPTGTKMHQMTNGSLSASTLSPLTSTWNPAQTYQAGEGSLVQNFSGSAISFQVYGIFGTNTFSRTLPTGYSIIASPLYHLLPGGSSTQIDALSSTSLGGLSQIPVNSSSNPKARADRNNTGVLNDYINYTLTTGSQWQAGGANTTVPILLGEGVWYENRFGSAQSWSVPLSIW